MSPGVSHALEQALAYYRTPALLAKAPQRPLPDDVIELLRLAAGDAAQAAQSAEASGESPQRVVEAAVFFVQQVMFTAQADAHRVLGVNPDAPAARIREHFHWLIRWLHPDRNADDWDSVYSDRVTRAWQALRRGGALAGEGENDGVEEYADRPLDGGVERHESENKLTVLAAARLARISRETPAMAPIVSARTARHLPAFVLGGLALAAVSLVALLWYAQQEEARRGLRTVQAAATAAPGAPAPATSPAQGPAPELAAPEPAAPEALATIPAPVPAAAAPAPELPAPEPPPRWAGGQPPPLPRSATPPPVSASAVPATQFAAASAPALPAVQPAPEPAPAPAPAYTAATATPDTAAAPPSPQARSTAQTDLIPEEKARALLSQFTDAYTAGNIQQLMALFTRDAVNNRGGRDAIAYDYQSLFSRSRERRLTLRPSGWVDRESEVVVLATYEAFVKEGRVLPGSTTRGAIRFTLRRENGELKISQVRHD